MSIGCGQSSHPSVVLPARTMRARRPGQALVEFALVLPIMVILLLTVVDLGRLFYSRIAISNAAREGAFQASKTPGSFVQGQPCDETTNLVTCRTLLEFTSTPSNWFVHPSAGDVRLSCSPSCAPGMGNLATVTVDSTFTLFSPWMAIFFSGSQNVPIEASATSQIETLPPVGAAPPTPPPTPTPAPTPTPTPTPLVCAVPSAGFTVNPTQGNHPLTVSVSDTSTSGALCPITEWLWDFGDGTTSNVQSPGTHTYNAKSNYKLTLTVTNSGGSNTSGKQTIQVK